MAWFYDLYGWLEKAFFNTLTRKLVGNISALLVLQLLVAAFGWYAVGSIADLAVKDTDLATRSAAVTQMVSQSQWLIGAVSLIALVCVIMTFLFLRYLIVRPIRQLNRQLASMVSAEADLSVHLQVKTHDEFTELASNYNLFLDRLRKTVGTIRQMGVNIAVSSAKVVNRVGSSSGMAAGQEDLAEEVFLSSSETTRSIAAISENSGTMAESTAQSLDTARNSFASLEALNSDIGKMQGRIAEHNQTIKQMDERSRDIGRIISTIQDISFQTGLLALNAAVEAARAGEAGKGFSVVAGEVKALAEQASRASSEIENQLNEMLEMIESSTAEADEISRFAAQTSEIADNSCRSFDEVISQSEMNNQRLTGITSSVDAISTANAAMHDKVAQIRSLSSEVGTQMGVSQQVAIDLQQVTERMQQLVSCFKTGEGMFEEILQIARVFRDACQERISALQQQGVNVFDTSYQQIAGTDPPKYATSYDRYFEQHLQPIYDKTAEQTPGGIFALCVDANGYGPTHNRKYSQPLTGDHDADLVHSRDKRIFNDPTGIRGAQNREEFLLQTYMRDTGEVLSDLSMPIMVSGRHWGAVRIGFDPVVMLENRQG